MTFFLGRTGPTRWVPTELAASMLSPGTRKVIHCWLTEPRFLDAHGEPAILLLNSDELAGFEGLVWTGERVLAPDRVLDELLTSGLATLCNETREILLRRTAYRPAEAQAPFNRRKASVGASPALAGLKRRRTDYGFVGGHD
ncbi:hypothetical protein [Marinobacter salicampi]|uniref:hypothetical protein n=1 Tax=Marinobacter salicampi TaxID=435907 RepID=UPI00140B95DB|nr:hypothetical protein [Marinobacter salicampi]